MSNSNLEDLMKKISEKLNIDQNQLSKAENKKEIDNILNKADPSDIEKAKKIISDKSALSKVLSTPAAKQILKKFLGGK